MVWSHLEKDKRQHYEMWNPRGKRKREDQNTRRRDIVADITQTTEEDCSGQEMLERSCALAIL